MQSKVFRVEIFATVCIGIAIRAIISLHSYSGASKPPMYGDYEAQRHWQEITINLAPKEWYRNSSENDLLYWGLDYPPLTAYHSYLMGYSGNRINESYVKLATSQGFQSTPHKSFMRSTVLLADILIYIPGALTLGFSLEHTFKNKLVLPFLIIMMIYPGQILIDNGHFQYNNISLGLAAFAISFILRKRYYSASLFFTLALNYKQMELYHALPFFAYLLRSCFSQKSISQGIRKLLLISSTVLLTFSVLWLPWMRSFDSIIAVVNRLFPINRGVFEDKVANFWCAANMVYKLKDNLSNHQMALLCLGTTLAAVLPLNVHLFMANKKLTFLYSLTNTAMAFFLLSFQVHEKSILLVALPGVCLSIFLPMETFLFLEVTVFSMFPLFIKDALIFPFFSMIFIFHICAKVIHEQYFSLYKTSKLYILSNLSSLSYFLEIFLALLAVFAPIPSRYPFIWALMISLFSCVHFVLFFVIGILYQFRR